MTLAVLVIDTSYLVELYKVPGFFSEAHHTEVKARFERAADARSRLFIPFPVIFEVANHIVDGRDDGARARLAKSFVEHVLTSFEQETPFIITPALTEENLKTLLRIFAGEFAAQRVGLTDAAIVEEGRRLKKKYGAQALVHIWTKDKRLKANEPDPERDPFVG